MILAVVSLALSLEPQAPVSSLATLVRYSLSPLEPRVSVSVRFCFLAFMRDLGFS